MKLARVSPAAPILAFGSREAAYQNLARLPEGAVGVMMLGGNGHVGMHEAPNRQVMVVIAGAGWVQGPDGGKAAVTAGDIVTFEAGEARATMAAASGLSFLVIEGALAAP